MVEEFAVQHDELLVATMLVRFAPSAGLHLVEVKTDSQVLVTVQLQHACPAGAAISAAEGLERCRMEVPDLSGLRVDCLHIRLVPLQAWGLG